MVLVRSAFILILFAFVFSLSPSIAQSKSTNHLIHHFEPLTSDKITYSFNSRHAKRSALYSEEAQTKLDSDLVIKITLSGEWYRLMLTQVPPPFTNPQNVTINGHKIDVDRFFDGFVSGFPATSSVSGFINSQGSFEGHVTINNATWLVESSDLVFEQDDVRREEIPTIAFRESDLDSSNFAGLCGNGDAVLPDEIKLKRTMRQSGNINAPPVKNTCKVLAVVDDTFSSAYKDNLNDITHAVSYFVKEADDIFQNTVFGNVKGYMLKIARFEIYTASMKNDVDNPFRELGANVGSSDFLRTLSEKSRTTQDWSPYCLVYAFTNRDFDNVLGEAYTGSKCPKLSWSSAPSNERT